MKTPSRIRQAAILLQSLDEATAALVLRHLASEDIHQLQTELEDIGRIDRSERDAAIAEFLNALRTRSGTETPPRPESPPQPPFAFLTPLPPEQVLGLLADESSQVMAVVLSHLPAAQSAAVIRGLPAARHLDVVRVLGTLGRPHPDSIREIESALRERLESTAVPAVHRPHNPPVPAPQPPAGARTSLHPAAVQHQQTRAFDDLTAAGPTELRRLVEAAGLRAWAVALYGASTPARESLLAALPPFNARQIREQIRALGPVRLADVDRAQQAIVRLWESQTATA